MQDIKRMQLYADARRVERELAALGSAGESPLDTARCARFDQLHYGGTSAVDEAARRLGIDAGTRVLDVGSGLGGPARHLAASTGCAVTAVELQPDFHDAASRLTRRCGLDDRVRHVRADFLEAEFEDRHDALVSWLTFLHIDDHAALFRRCRAALVDGGALFAEDFVADAPLTVRERRLLSEEVYCRALPDRDRYRERLESAGFTDVEMHSMTEPWTRFVVARERAFAADRERYRRLHGRAAEERLARFYGVVRELFEGGNLGGARIVARAAPNPGTAALR